MAMMTFLKTENAKMKKNLKYNVLQSTYYQNSEGLVSRHMQHVEFTKRLPDGNDKILLFEREHIIFPPKNCHM